MKDYSFKSLTLRLITRGEVNRWEDYLRRYHYLGYRNMPGELLRYVATVNDEWVAVIGWSSAALKCSARDKYIGWDEDKKLKRLHYVTNNVRFLILPWIKIKNLASKVLALNLRRLSSDYEAIYGHPVYLAETFVDLSLHKGTCYKASNWLYLGQTRGYSKNGKRYYPNGKPKGVFVYPLLKGSKEALSAEFLPTGGKRMTEGGLISMNEMPVERLVDIISRITDPRKRRGIRHQLVSILSIAVCAVLCGARSFIGIGEWAKGLSKEALKRFGCRRGRPPSEPTIRRVLQRIDVVEFDRAIGNWLITQGLSLEGKGIAVDGKTLRGSNDGDGGRVHLLSAIIHKEGVVIGQKRVANKTNEIKVVEPLFDDLEIKGAVVTGDALLAQKEIAEYIVREKRADYVVTVKANQETLLKDIKDLKLESFPPSTHNDR